MCDSRCAAERKNDLQMAQRCFCSMPDPEEPVDPGEDVCGGLGGEKLYSYFLLHFHSLYRAGRLVICKVLKIRIWVVPPACLGSR